MTLNEGSVGNYSMVMDLRAFLDDLQEHLPYDFVRIERPISPEQFEATALLQHLENQKKFPVLFFEKPLDLNGKPSAFPLLSNVFATRQRCALSLGMKPNEGELPLSLEYARREDTMIDPVTISASEAPVKQVIKRGNDANIFELPVVRHHAMDPAPYIDMTPVMKDPDEGFYNIAFQRNMVKGPRKLGLHMSPRHNWQIHRKNEERNRPTPVAIVISHHPAFYLGSLNVSAFGVDDYTKVGAIMCAALPLTMSGSCRFNCYISIDKKVDGETKQAALAALGGCDFVKHVVVVDADIDIYNEEEVMWAVATRVQADQDVDIIKNVKGNTLDPSQTDNIMTAKMIIDATKSVQRPYEARVAVPKAVMETTRLEDFIPRAVLDRMPKV